MTATALLLILLGAALPAGDAVSEAGSAYRQAQQALEAEKYEEAVGLLRGALQQVGAESDSLKYRDDASRRHHSYYPYYEWGRARLMQAVREPSIFNQRDLLQDAIGRLGQSRHPGAGKQLEEAKSRLVVVKEQIALDASFNGIKSGIEVLGSGERFTEAFRQLDDAQIKFKARGKELEEVRATLKEKQAVTVKRYEQMAMQRLSDVVLMDPVTAGESIVPLLMPALVPPGVIENGGPTFDWVKKLIAVWEKQMETVRKAAELPGAQVIASAETLDATALEALTVNLPSGFRACRHLAQTARLAKLRDIASGNEDVLDTATARAVAKSGTDASAKAGEAASRLGDKEARERLHNDLAAHEAQLADISKKIEAGAKERERLTGPILRSETALADGDTVGDLAALGKLKNDLFELESEGTFGTLTARLRARALFAHSLAEAMIAFLEGKNQAETVDRCRLPAWRAYGFDPKVDARWSERLSPKMKKVYDQIRPQ